MAKLGALLALTIALLAFLVLRPSQGTLRAFPGATIDCTQTADGCHLYGGQMVEHTLYVVDSTHKWTCHIDGGGECKLFDVVFYQVDDQDPNCEPGVQVKSTASRGWAYAADVRFSGQGYGDGGTGAKCARLLVDGVGFEGTHLVAGICEGTATGVPCVIIKRGETVIDGTFFRNVGRPYDELSPGPCRCYPIIGTLK